MINMALGCSSTMRLTGLLALLAAARILGAVYYLVHDCDEVYNYWEPLHFLVNGTGMQTWEYRYDFS